MDSFPPKWKQLIINCGKEHALKHGLEIENETQLKGNYSVKDAALDDVAFPVGLTTCGQLSISSAATTRTATWMGTASR